VIIDAGPHLDLLDLDDLLLLARVGGLLLLLIFEFTKIKDFADRGLRIRGYLDKVETRGAGPLQRIETAYDANVLAVFVDQADIFGPDRFVDPGAGRLALRRAFSQWTADVQSPSFASSTFT
jgi:hypothetical protein